MFSNDQGKTILILLKLGEATFTIWMFWIVFYQRKVTMKIKAMTMKLLLKKKSHSFLYQLEQISV